MNQHFLKLRSDKIISNSKKDIIDLNNDNINNSLNQNLSINLLNSSKEDITHNINQSGLTIGLLINNYHNFYNNILWRGIKKGIDENKCKLINFVGGNFTNPDYDNSQTVKIYNLALSRRVDGILILSTTMGNYISTKKLNNFVDSFNSIPLVSIGVSFKNNYNIIINNETGIRQLVNHLIRVHGYRKIALICGPSENAEVKIRYKTYIDVLKSYEISVDPKLIVNGEFSTNYGEEAVAELIDNRKVHFDALIASNDHVAVNVIKELQNRGIRVPEDVAVAGFDDLKLNHQNTPLLTTVRQPIYKLGYKSVQLLTSILEGKKIESDTIIPSHIVIRESCGCKYHTDKKENINITSIYLADSQKNIITESMLDILMKKMDMEFNNTINLSLLHNWAELILKTLLEDVEDNLYHNFINILEKIINETLFYQTNFLSWNNILFSIFNEIIPNFKIKADNSIITNLLRKSIEVVQNTIVKKFEFSFLKFNNFTISLTFLKKKFMSTYMFKEIKNIINKYFIEIGIKNCFISLFNNKWRNEISEFSRLLITNNKYKKIFINKKKRFYHTEDLLPDSLYKNTKNNPFLIYSISNKNKQFGFIIFEIDNNFIKNHDDYNSSFSIYEALIIDMTNCIKRIILRNKKRKNKINTILEKNNKYKKCKLSKVKAVEYYNKLINIMEKNKPYLNPDLTPEMLSGMLYISRHHLSYIINEYFHVNFYDFVNSYRIEIAKDYLINNNHNFNILDAAYDSGFNSKSTFYRTFKEVVKMTPLQFRKKYRKSET